LKNVGISREPGQYRHAVALDRVAHDSRAVTVTRGDLTLPRDGIDPVQQVMS